MIHPSKGLLALFTVSVCLNAPALVTIDSVYVGNIGNPSDPTTGYGTVDYGYAIGKYEVTLSQYTAFLNAVAVTDTYGLYNIQMGSSSSIMGIARSGISGGYTYSVIGSDKRPVTYVSWFDAVRFVNWLHNGQPMGGQNASTTERGAYTLDGALSGIITRNVGWGYGLPSQNEWYKAAYYQPSEHGGDADGYWLYPTQGDIQPNSRNGSNTDSNSANYRYDDGINNGFNGGYAVNDSTALPIGNALTEVGAFSLAASYYGTFDQGGNVIEWNDAVFGGARGQRGGGFTSTEGSLRASVQGQAVPTTERNISGFRVVIVPEPSQATLITLAIAMLFGLRRRIC